MRPQTSNLMGALAALKWKACLCRATLHGASSILYSIAWSPDASKLAASSADGGIYMYDIKRGRLVASLRHHSKHSHR